MFENPDFVLSIAMVIFLGVLAYYGVHKMLFRLLDERADKIRAELDEARRLREEAQTLLASYERRQSEVKEQAAAIITRAHQDAEDAAEAAKADIEESVERRLRAAEEQIGLAEEAAVREVRDRAIEVATAAAAEVIARKLTDARAGQLIDSAIETVGAKLN